MNLRMLSDEELLSRTKRLATREREIMIEVLHHLLEVNLRKVFSPTYQNMMEYATKELGYSQDQAWRRIQAMKLLKEIPEIANDIADAKLNLTTLGLAQNHFQIESASREQKLKTLEALRGKSTREAARELMLRSSQPEKIQHIESVRPVSQTANEVRLILTDDVLEKISKLKGRLAHSHPHLSNSDLFEIMLDRTLAATDPATEPTRICKPVAAPRSGEKRRTPNAALKREIYRRADGRCELCSSNFALEDDHQVAFALGGPTSLRNMRLLCRNCNQREAIKVFGVRR